MNFIKMPNTALLIIDMQVGVVAKAHARDEVIARINDLVTQSRKNQVPVIWVQHSDQNMKIDSEAWQIVPELRSQKEDVMIRKIHGDAFEETDLKTELDRRQVGRLIVTGAQTDACIRSTLHGAFVRGYDTVLVSDAHTTEDLTTYGLPSPEQLIAFTNAYWKWQTGPGRTASVEQSAKVRWS